MWREKGSSFFDSGLPFEDEEIMDSPSCFFVSISNHFRDIPTYHQNSFLQKSPQSQINHLLYQLVGPKIKGLSLSGTYFAKIFLCRKK